MDGEVHADNNKSLLFLLWQIEGWRGDVFGRKQKIKVGVCLDLLLFDDFPSILYQFQSSKTLSFFVKSTALTYRYLFNGLFFLLNFQQFIFGFSKPFQVYSSF